MHRSQQLSLAEQDPPAAQCCALGCGLGTSGLCWAVSHWLPVSWLHDPLAGLSCSCAACVEVPELQPGLGLCCIPMANPPFLALPLLSTMFPLPTSFFNWDWSRGIHAGAEPGQAGTASSCRGWAAPGGDIWLRLGLRRTNKHIMTLQPGWAQEALSVTEPLAGSSLIKGCRR